MSVFPLSREGDGTLWLASYPRSGNTLLRMILNKVFGLQTASIYAGEIRTWQVAGGLAEMVGHYENVDQNRAAYGAAFLPLKAFKIVKTHEAPLDDGPGWHFWRRQLIPVDRDRALPRLRALRGGAGSRDRTGLRCSFPC